MAKGTCDHPYCYGPTNHFGKHYGKMADKDCPSCGITHPVAEERNEA